MIRHEAMNANLAELVGFGAVMGGAKIALAPISILCRWPVKTALVALITAIAATILTGSLYEAAAFVLTLFIGISINCICLGAGIVALGLVIMLVNAVYLRVFTDRHAAVEDLLVALFAGNRPPLHVAYPTQRRQEIEIQIPTTVIEIPYSPDTPVDNIEPDPQGPLSQKIDIQVGDIKASAAFKPDELTWEFSQRVAEQFHLFDAESTSLLALSLDGVPINTFANRMKPIGPLLHNATSITGITWTQDNKDLSLLYKCNSSGIDYPDRGQCSTCLDDFPITEAELSNNPVTVLKCNHAFHTMCIQAQLNNFHALGGGMGPLGKCAYCRKPVDTVKYKLIKPIG